MENARKQLQKLREGAPQSGRTMTTSSARKGEAPNKNNRINTTSVPSNLRKASLEDARGPSRVLGSQRKLACNSHVDNEAYMSKMEDAFEALGHSRPSGEPRPGPLAAEDSLSKLSGPQAGKKGPYQQTPQGGAPAASWGKPPEDPKGSRVDFSDRNIICMSIRDQTAVVGSCDHGVYEFNILSNRRGRKLYDQRNGHKEWVTSVTYLPDGRIASAGMDSKLCLWDAKGVRCVDLVGHSGSISQVLASADARGIVSCSYDKTVRYWDVSGARPREALLSAGHKAPVLALGWSETGLIASGDRAGSIHVCDLATGLETLKCSGAHHGHVTSMEWMSQTPSTLLLTGGQDGYLRAWDPRKKGMVMETPLHVSKSGAGAVAGIRGCPAAGAVVTAGADKKVHVLDPLQAFTPRSTFNEHKEFIYSLEVYGKYCFSGDGVGMLHVYDVEEEKLMYGLGANAHAVRCIGMTPTHLVAAGDDGKALIWKM